MLLIVPLVFATLTLAAPSQPRRSPSANVNMGSILPLVFQVDPKTAFSRPAPIYATINEVDDARFGEACNYGGASAAYIPCGDFLQLSTGIDHALFCSPLGVCAGEMAACGSDDACDEGLSCNANTHKCAVPGSFKVSTNAARLDERRKTASATCPELSEACPTGAGGFECVFSLTEVESCGGCPESGGQRCAQINNALSTSCRDGACVVHSCSHGYAPSDDGDACEEVVEASDE